MKHAALALLTVVIAACGAGDDGTFKLTWRVTEGGAASSCQAIGGTTIKVTSTRKSTSTHFVDLFACAKGSGTTGELHPGSYTVSIELLDAMGKALSQPFSLDRRILSGEESPLGDFDFDFPATAALSATWRVLVNEAPANCPDVGAVSVILDSTPVAGGTTIRDTFPCASGAGVTDALPAGMYKVKVTLVDAQDQPLSTVEVTVTVTGHETRSIGHVEFPLEYHQASFKAHFGAAGGSNCGRADVQEVRVSDMARQQCLSLPITGLVNTASEPISGMTCARTLCQAESVGLALQRLAPGTYGVQLLGYQGTGAQPALCYISDILDVTVAHADVSLGTLVAEFDDSMDSQHLCINR